MEKKSLKNFGYVAFLLVFMLICPFLLSACGSKPIAKPWGKTLSYVGIASIDGLKFEINHEVITVKKICIDYFDHIDWESTLGKTKEELQNGENAYTILKNMGENALEISRLETLSLTFSAEENHSVTIYDETYDVEVEGENSSSEYIVKLKNYESDQSEKATFRLYDTNDNKFIYDYYGSLNQLPKCFYIINLSFDDTVLIGSKGYETHGDISINFIALFA